MVKLRIHTLIAEKGITPQDLAEKSGLTRQTVQSLLVGMVRRIELETMDKLCKALDVEPGELLERD